jgi:L-serine dehydratase
MEFISVFDMLKIGVGPSSSHTLGPWKAARAWTDLLQQKSMLTLVTHVEIHLYGSLAKTGRGHGTDIAVQMGLLDADPETFDTSQLKPTLKQIDDSMTLMLRGQYPIVFNPKSQIHFHMNEALPFHANGLTFIAFSDDQQLDASSYYSTGGGFIVQDGVNNSGQKATADIPYPTDTAKQLQAACNENAMNIAEIAWANEIAVKPEAEVRARMLLIWRTMLECAWRGCHTDGILEGGLNVTRRAKSMYLDLVGKKTPAFDNPQEWLDHLTAQKYTFFQTMQLLSTFAFAVNEENAAYGRVVTAPTNGAAGVIPAVLLFYVSLSGEKVTEDKIINFLCIAAQIGAYFKKHATISAAMGGCQAEIGVSSSMAAAALTECLGGSVGQALMAGEIAMEHHLGMTCDPIGGLVQIPCIERNSMGAIKAIMATTIALENDPAKARVSLDEVIKTMWETAKDMNHKYKETSEGGLAIQVPVSHAEC